MEPWLKISLLVCIFGFLKEIRPSEPYIYDYLTGPWKNFTDDQVVHEVYPIGTYSNMLLLLIVFLLTDIARYKPFIVILGLSGMVVWGMLIWTYSLFEMQIVEVFYGMFMAAEVAYYTYIYAKVSKDNFQRVTSHSRGAILAGRALSGLAAQLLTSTDVLDFKQLNYITFTSVTCATFWALFLPPVKTTIYFHQSNNSENNLNFMEKSKAATKLMLEHIRLGYGQVKILKWCLWWSLSTCGYIQVEFYIQPLYSQIIGDDVAAYNGGVEATLTLLGFCAALLAGYLKFNWDLIGEVTLALFSVIQGALIVVASQTDEIFLCYSLYIVFGVMFHFMVTIASAQIAKQIDEDSYGLIFGINQFIALVFNSLLTTSVATKDVGFNLGPRGQYVVYGGYHVGIALIFAVIGLFNWCRNRNS